MIKILEKRVRLPSFSKIFLFNKMVLCQIMLLINLYLFTMNSRSEILAAMLLGFLLLVWLGFEP